MSLATNTQSLKNWVPNLKSKWWTVLLGGSLMINLLVGGVMVGRFAGGHRMERLAGVSYVQLIPRNFFRDLPSARRQELMQIVKDSSADLRNLRASSEATSVKLADALENANFSLDEVKQAVQLFSTGTESLAARGGDVVVKIVSQLSADERKILAQSIRQRAQAGKRQN